MIDLTINEAVLERNVQKARENGVVIPTLAQMKDPEANTPPAIKQKLRDIGLWDVNPLNLFRITWKNQPKQSGGGYAGPNFIVLPRKLTGVKARIICMVGKWFPTGCHKVGASYGCLVPRLVTSQFNAGCHTAIYPSTGNYYRAAAFNSQLLSGYSVAILPQGMSRDRFGWLDSVSI